MRRVLSAIAVVLGLLVPSWPAPAEAQDSYASSPVALARELLVRARRLDDGATNDEKVATSLATELPGKRVAAKAARDAVAKASADQKAAAEAKAEDLETDVIVTEAEINARRNSAAEDRRMAKDLRARAIRLAQGNAAELRRYRPNQSDIF